MKLDIKDCPCCGENHYFLNFELLKNSEIIEIQNKKYNYSALCPVINEKIYLGSFWGNDDKMIFTCYFSIPSFIQKNIIWPYKRDKIRKQKIQDEKERKKKWETSKQWIENRKKEIQENNLFK
jgi:hypothetical protein